MENILYFACQYMYFIFLKAMKGEYDFENVSDHFSHLANVCGFFLSF